MNKTTLIIAVIMGIGMGLFSSVAIVLCLDHIPDIFPFSLFFNFYFRWIVILTMGIGWGCLTYMDIEGKKAMKKQLSVNQKNTKEKKQ